MTDPTPFECAVAARMDADACYLPEADLTPDERRLHAHATMNGERLLASMMLLGDVVAGEDTTPEGWLEFVKDTLDQCR